MATRTPKTISNNPLETIGVRGVSQTKPVAPKKAVSTRAKRPAVADVKTAKPELSAAVVSDTVKVPEITSPMTRSKAPDNLTDAQPNKISEIAELSLVEEAGKTQDSYSEIVTADDIFAEEYKSSSSVVVLPKSTTSADTVSNIFALHAVKSWSQWAVVAGLVPVPVADTVAISGVQISMIHELCKHYKVEFKKEAALAVVSGLIAGKFTTTFANIAGNIFLNNLPVIGTVMKYTTQPALSYATTYALGRVFIKHFESKGTMVDLDSKRLAAYFKEQFAKGRKLFKAEFKDAAIV